MPIETVCGKNLFNGPQLDEIFLYRRRKPAINEFNRVKRGVRRANALGFRVILN